MSRFEIYNEITDEQTEQLKDYAKLLTGFDVIFFKSCSSLPPAIFSKPDDIIDIPYKKNAKPPINVKIE